MSDDKQLVNKWLRDVSRAGHDRDSLLGVIKSKRRALEELERFPAGHREDVDPARCSLMHALAHFEARECEHSYKVSEFLDAMEQLPDALVARALVLRVTEGDTWQRCATRLHVNLERRYNRSLPELAKLMPNIYKE